MTDKKTIPVPPTAAAAHHRAGEQFWQNHALYLQTVIEAQTAQIKALQLQISDNSPNVIDTSKGSDDGNSN